MRLVCKVMATLMLATALLQAASVRPIAASSPLSSVEQAWPAGVIFACPINFTIRTGLPNAPVTDKRHERYVPTRCPTILIRGAPFIQTRGIKTRGNFSAASVAVGAFGFDLKKAPSLCSPAQ